MSAGCTPYVCKTFEAGPNDTCVLLNNETIDENYVRTCDANKSCGANSWNSTADAVDSANCSAEDTTTILNFTVPGDKCNDTTECFNGFFYNVSCAAGICKTDAPSKDADCTFDVDTGDVNGTKSCPVGTFCNGTKCVSQLGKGENCTAFQECKTGYGCLQVVYPDEKATNTFQCEEYWTLASGTGFDATNMRMDGNVLTYIDACATHHVIPNKTLYECRTAPKGAYTNESDLVRPGPESDDCTYTTFDDPANATAPTVQNDTAKCGFNNGSSAYCDKREGDPWFQDAFEKVRARPVSELACHAYSNLSSCTNFLDKIGRQLYTSWTRELLSADENHGYALYADNDDCVRDSITSEYWYVVDDPDSAFDILTLSSFAAMVLAISTLFYMF